MDTLGIKKVSKHYGNFTAVDRVSFQVPQGVIYGLLGPNGAGKTSLIRIINSITMADEGEILFCGETLGREHQAKIGYLPEERGLYKKMSVQDQLEYLGQLKGLDAKTVRTRIAEWYAILNMDEWGNKKIEDLSKGMQQKVQFVATVLHEPQLLILDEPFSGLDPVNTNLLKQEIRRLRAEGTTILFSTHRMEQVEEICERIALINKGSLVLEGPIADIKQRYKDFLFEFIFAGDHRPDFSDETIHPSSREQGIVLQLESLEQANTRMRQWMDEGYVIHEFREILPSINDIFIKIVTTEA
ncbi:ATP-binding cassette domain-containing protein [Membranicola marinus]|uniref:ATP-binding cassette domain-containing protein n=1 Tax=Membranihabitans marinus TaxID=1227546 RepID=A0A953HMI7_9BACT|nr:ATP-binding cassette domain-containing protein [Membranihabitans marinus]MBY5957829.1 ATP-binding cassette domain-containing protein [Membranihabitans marinus]